MTERHCYDSNVLIGILRDDLRALDLVARHGDAGFEQATTAVSALELSMGATTALRRANAQLLLESMQSLPFDAVTAWQAGQQWSNLAKAGKMPGAYDLLVGATARRHGWTLHTFDQGFPELDGLDLVKH